MNERIALTMDMIQDDGSMSYDDAKIAGNWLRNVLSTTYAGTETTLFLKGVVNDLDEETLRVLAFTFLKGFH